MVRLERFALACLFVMSACTGSVVIESSRDVGDDGTAFVDAGFVDGDIDKNDSSAPSDAMVCDDGNECTYPFVYANGDCISLPYNLPHPCVFNGSTGVCVGSVCSCDSHDDCNDGNSATIDRCWDHVCWFSDKP